MSSAQITENYTSEEFIGKQIIAVTNFPVKRVAGNKSEVLVLACVEGSSSSVVLLQPSLRLVESSRVP